jgi:hypothetical protein
MRKNAVTAAVFLWGWLVFTGCAHAPARCPDQSGVVCMTQRVCRTDSGGCQVCICEGAYVPPESTAPPGQPPFGR